MIKLTMLVVYTFITLVANKSRKRTIKHICIYNWVFLFYSIVIQKLIKTTKMIYD